MYLNPVLTHCPKLRQVQRVTALAFGRIIPVIIEAALWVGASAPAMADDAAAVAGYRSQVRPIMERYCAECHMGGNRKGDVDFDSLKSDEAILNRDLWNKVLINLRSGFMPPKQQERPTAAEQKTLEEWIKYQDFGLKVGSPDPGPVVDELTLASRLAKFLWSSLPDDELLSLAGKGELRRQLPAQVKRMVADPRAEALVNGFTGQWLNFAELDKPYFPKTDDPGLRTVMMREAEMVFSAIMHEDRSVKEFI